MESRSSAVAGLSMNWSRVSMVRVEIRLSWPELLTEFERTMAVCMRRTTVRKARLVSMASSTVLRGWVLGRA